MLTLKTFGSRAAIGTAGDIRLDGPGVLPRHARLFCGSDGRTWLEPFGDVWLERGRLRELITHARRLDHGDVLVIGEHLLTFRDAVGATLGRKKQRRPSWSR